MSLHSSEMTPMSKKDFLVIEEMANEVLVYNTTNNKLHILSPVAAEVWKRCDGKTTISRISSQLTFGTDNNNKADIVRLALDELNGIGLIQNHSISDEKLSRRIMMRKVALATALAFPLISTLTAPTPAQATSGGTGGGPPSDGCEGKGGGNCGKGGGGGGGNGTGNQGNGKGPN